MINVELEKIINEKLNSFNCNDCTINGLQVEGRKIVKKVITGVTASQKLLEAALHHQADAIIVHHGYFWTHEHQAIRDMKRRRLKILLDNDINLYSWHLPLDIDPELGNNVQLAKILNINIIGRIELMLPWGELSTPLSGIKLMSWIETCLDRRPLWYGNTGPDLVKHIAWCTGRGQNFINNAARFGIDAFITGEVSEQTIHSAHEQNIHFYAAGHHATERGGICALSKWLTNNSNDLDVIFVDINNPV